MVGSPHGRDADGHQKCTRDRSQGTAEEKPAYAGRRNSEHDAGGGQLVFQLFLKEPVGEIRACDADHGDNDGSDGGHGTVQPELIGQEGGSPGFHGIAERSVADKAEEGDPQSGCQEYAKKGRGVSFLGLAFLFGRMGGSQLTEGFTLGGAGSFHHFDVGGEGTVADDPHQKCRQQNSTGYVKHHSPIGVLEKEAGDEEGQHRANGAGGGDAGACRFAAVKGEKIREGADDGRPKHGVEQAVQSPDQGHDGGGGSQSHGQVAQAGAAESRTDHVAGLDAGAQDAVEDLSSAVDQHVGGIDRASEGQRQETVSCHGGDTGGEILTSDVAAGVGQKAVQEQAGGALIHPLFRPFGSVMRYHRESPCVSSVLWEAEWMGRTFLR